MKRRRLAPGDRITTLVDDRVVLIALADYVTPSCWRLLRAGTVRGR